VLGPAVAAAALALVVALPGGSAGARSASAVPLRVTAALQPAQVRFGDPVTADVRVEYDPRAIDASSIRVQPSFVPYVVSSTPAVRRLAPNVLRYRYSLVCLTSDCLPAKGARVLRLQPVTATAEVGARLVTAASRRPALRIASRLRSSDLAGRLRFRSATAAPLPHYRVSPGLLAAGLLAGAVACALVAALLAGRGLRRALRTGAPRVSRLERAIAYVLNAATRAEPDRRRALELLAEAVAEGGDPALSAAAVDSAWARRPPTPAQATELAERAARLGAGAG
jgi:hypothetical protein